MQVEQWLGLSQSFVTKVHLCTFKQDFLLVLSVLALMLATPDL